MNKKVIIGLSGGVDSSVSAYLLQKSGYDIEAVYMQNWDSLINGENNSESNSGCSNKEDLEDAKKVAKHLGIKLHIVEFIEKYWTEVFQIFLEKYKNGLTPNPDVLCNKYIKFESFRNYVFENFDADFFALGHYAQKKINNDGSCDLIMSYDTHKDQTYFLCSLNQEQLKYALFPIGGYKKDEIRNIAKKYGLPTWNKKDSTGICFIGKKNFQNFLSNYIPNKVGNIIDIKTGEIIGQHKSAIYYTIGQRKKIGLSGMNDRYYVCKKDVDKNIIYVSSDDNITDNFKIITIDNFNWINKKPKTKNVKIRYRHCGDLFPAIWSGEDKIVIKFEKPQKSLNNGQYAVMYIDNICFGGGEISKIE